MHRAIAPAVMMPGIISRQPDAASIARFVLSNSSVSYSNGVPKDADFDTIHEQSGFSPALTGTVTSITVPTGATRLICSCWTGSSGTTGVFFQTALAKNGSVITGFVQTIHGGFYSANHISGIAEVSGGDTISLQVLGNHSSSTSVVFAGKFY